MANRDMQRDFWKSFSEPAPAMGYAAGPAIATQTEHLKDGSTVFRFSYKDADAVAVELRFSAAHAPSSAAWQAVLNALWQAAQGGGGQPRPKPAGCGAKALADAERQAPEVYARDRAWDALRQAGKVQGLIAPPGWTPPDATDATIIPNGA